MESASKPQTQSITHQGKQAFKVIQLSHKGTFIKDAVTLEDEQGVKFEVPTPQNKDRFENWMISLILDDKFGREADNITAAEKEAKEATQEYLKQWFEGFDNLAKGEHNLTVADISELADGFHAGYLSGKTGKVVIK